MSVIIQMWKRLAPSRTKKLSTSWVMILRLTGRGKVAHCGLVVLTFHSVTLSFFQVFIFVFIKLTKALRFFSVFQVYLQQYTFLSTRSYTTLYKAYLHKRLSSLQHIVFMAFIFVIKPRETKDKSKPIKNQLFRLLDLFAKVDNPPQKALKAF